MLLDYLKAAPQYIAPQHGLSLLLGGFANIEQTTIKNAAIKAFMRVYGVDLSEAEITDPTQYPTFNDFFIRKLKPEARPIVQQDNAIACPVDGCVSQVGRITAGQIIQAKGHHYSVHDLLGGNIETCEAYLNGHFSTLYLAPRDYHRVHMPVTGQLKEMIYIPGKLFSVNHSTTQVVPRLFARNERLVCFFDTESGPMAVVLVGAMIVASISTVWEQNINASRSKKVRQVCYPNPKTDSLVLNRGDELGYFKLGSTVIVLFGNDDIQFDKQITSNNHVRMGQLLGNY